MIEAPSQLEGSRPNKHCCYKKGAQLLSWQSLLKPADAVMRSCCWIERLGCTSVLKPSGDRFVLATHAQVACSFFCPHWVLSRSLSRCLGRSSLSAASH